MVGTAEPQRVGVGDVVRGHLARERVRVDAGGGRRGVDLVVDVGDVRDESDRVALVHEEALEQREDDEGSCVADVDPSVHGRPAGVNPDLARLAGAQRQHLAAERVVERDLSH